jgi:hypothetical protein
MASSSTPREVGHVRDALHREFDEFVDMTDVRPDQHEQQFLSRALSALVVRKLAGIESSLAAGALVDGFGDTGIDAVAISDRGSRLWLLQSKWSDRGTASFNVAAALKLVEGLKLIDAMKFDRLNAKFQRHAARVEAVLRDPRTKITLVVVLMGPAELHPDVAQRLKDAQKDFNQYSAILDYEVWGTERLWRTVRDDLAEPPIDLTAKMDEWTYLAEPYEAYQGRVSVAEIAEWYTAHGDRLFEKNIRKSLGLTEVNYGLVDTLTQDPGLFWYYNNGITLLCDTAERHNWRRGTRSPVELCLRGASVVNGAQTVTAIAEAMQREPGTAADGYVGVKVVTTENCPDDFGIAVTRTTNTQNSVERRDFAALDRVQEDIRDDFALTLGKTYSFKRGELDPAPEAGCSIVEAAIAMACAHRNPELAARVKQNSDLLWEPGPTGVYSQIFSRPPSALRVWRTVVATRSVRASLSKSKDGLDGRAKVIAEQGDFLITHVVFRCLDAEGIEDPNCDWRLALEEAEDLTLKTLTWLVYHLDAEFGPTSYIGSTFANPVRCELLAAKVSGSLVAGQPIPDIPEEYRTVKRSRRGRRPNAVPTLVNSGRIPDGTILIYEAYSGSEAAALSEWLGEDARRGRASWINSRAKPLLWSYDGKRYSPSGLVALMWEQAGWRTRHRAVQGPSRWHLPGQGSLWQLARQVMDELDDPPDSGVEDLAGMELSTEPT